ncbi:hypothetical protein LC607_30290 [Nostoc sp. CHAB 5824]|nr:hypothetical protein [Nostoc sp. CHAB 5824]
MQKSYEQNDNKGEIYNAENINIVKEQIIKISENEIKTRQLIAASPYKGLDKFNENDKDFFFGRASFISNLIQVISKKNLILLFGASGSGKSSVILAGLIPKLKEQRRTAFEEFVFIPDIKPFLSLFSAFLGKGYNQNQVKTALSPKENTLNEIITNLKKEKPQCLWLIYIDQFEQLFTISDDKERDCFISSLVNLYESLEQSQDQTVKIVITMRADFLEQISSYPNLATIIQGNMHLIPDMHPNELWLAIEQPAAKHGVVFEQGLVDEIIKEFKGQAGLLPLLQYTLDLLWKGDNIIDPNDPTQTKPHPHTDRTLNIITYRELGGITGALQQRGSEIYQRLDQEQKEITKQIFLKLINTVETKSGLKTVSRRADINEFTGKLVKDTLTAFIEEKLLVTHNYNINMETVFTSNNKLPKNSSTVEIAHEILLDSWDKLKEWIDENKELISIKNWLTNETIRYLRLKTNNEEKANDELLKGYRLDEIIVFKDKNVFDNLGGLSIDEQQFLQASIEYRDRSEQEKLERILDANISSSQLLFASNKRLDALVNLIKIGNTLQNEFKKYEYSRLRFLVMIGHIFSELAEYNSINAHKDEVTSITCSPNEKIIASASYRGIIRLWNADGIFIDEIKTDQGTIDDLTFSSDGQILASASSHMDDGSIKLWKISISTIDTNNKKNVSVSELNRFVGHLDRVNSISFRPGDVNSNLKDEIIIASASQDGTIKLWSLQENPVKTLENYNKSLVKSPVKCVVFSPNGKMIASGDVDGFIKLWTHNGELVASIEAHTKSVTSVNFCPDSKVLISSGRDKRIKFWNTQKAEDLYLTEFYEQDREVLYVNFSPDGRLIAATDIDGKIKVWFDNEKQWSQESKLLRIFKHEKEVPKVIFSKDSKKLISCSFDKTIKFWNCSSKFDGYDNGKFNGHTDRITSIEANVVGKIITTTSKDGTVKVWDHDGKLLQNHSSNNYENEGEEFGINIKDTPIRPKNQTNLLIEYIEKLIEEIKIKYGRFSAKYFSLDCGLIAVAFYGENDGYQKINRVRVWNLDLDKVLEEAELYTQNYQKSADKNKNVIS